MTVSADASANAAVVLVDRHITQSDGDRTALKYGAKRYSYHDLAALMNRAGNMLRNLGVEAGRHVVVAVNPSPACVASLLGAMKIGAVPVLAAEASDKVLKKTLDELDPAVIIADASRAAAIQKTAGKRTVIVVGGDAGPDRSFVELLRASASSLSRGSVEPKAKAVAVLGDGGMSHASHADVGKAEKSGALKLPAHGGVDVGAMLAAFARGGEFTLPG